MKTEAESFKVLSVESRIKIIELLKAGPLSVNTIAEALGVSQSAVSQHLRIMKQAGLVSDERKGYYIYYSLNKDKLDKYQQGLKKVCACGCELGRKRKSSETKEALSEYKKQLEKELKQVEEKIKACEKKGE